MKQAIEQLFSFFVRWARWIANPTLRRYEWGFSERYWKWRSFLQSKWFHAFRMRFEASERLRSQKQSASILWELVKLVFPQFLLIAGIMILFGILELLFLHYMPMLLRWAGWNIWAVAIEGLWKYEPAANVFSKIGEIIAPLAGLFLSIYFATVSIVASTVYAKAPNDIRQMFMREQASGFYMRMLSWCVCVGILALGAGRMEQQLGFLNLVLMGFLTFWGILSFGVLGLRVLDFFDPARLTEYLESNLAKWIVAATPHGYKWDDSSFQSYYQRQTEEVLRSYGNLLILAKERKPLRLAEFLCRAILFLPRYVQLKGQIPTNSQWFKQRYKHLNWLTTSSTQTDVALQAGIRLKPEVTPDHMWFESQFEVFLLDGFLILLGDEREHDAKIITNEVTNALRKMAENQAVEEALRLHRMLGKIIREHLGKTVAPKATSEEMLNDRYNIDMLDCYAHGIIQILLGLSDCIGRANVETFGRTVAEMRWEQSGAIYRYCLPRAVVTRLELLQKGLLFERDVEGKQRSPAWYVQEIAAVSYIRYLREALSEIMTEIEMCFVKQFETIFDKHPARMATLIEIGLEACDKCRYHFGKIQNWHDGMVKAFHREPEIIWPEINWANLYNRVAECHKLILNKYAKLAPTLAELPVTDDWPDYFGHAYTVLIQACYDAMASGDEPLFAQLYLSVFKLSLVTPSRLHPLLVGQTDRVNMLYSTESIVELMCLSGIAMIYSELDDKKFWAIAKKVWDSFLEKHANPKDVIEAMFAAVYMRDSDPVITPRCGIRTKWDMDIHQKLVAHGLVGWVRPPQFLKDRKCTPPHKSHLINIVTKGEMSFDSPDDIFIALYLSKRSEAKGLEIPARVQMFIESMDDFQKNSDDAGHE